MLKPCVRSFPPLKARIEASHSPITYYRSQFRGFGRGTTSAKAANVEETEWHFLQNLLSVVSVL